MNNFPHGPYIAAVLTELDNLVGPDTHVDYDETIDGTTLLEAFIDLGGHAPARQRPALLWRPTTGWRAGDYSHRGVLEYLGPLVPGDPEVVLPTPKSVAAAARYLVDGQGVQAGLVDTAPVAGPLPRALRDAVSRGDVTEVLAASLAAYAVADPRA